MSDPIASIIRFNGDPDDLVERFDRARRLWIDAQDDDYERPSFYAVGKTDDGIVLITGWDSVAGHQAFGRRMGPHLEATGLAKPDGHEHVRIARLGWD